MQPKDLNNVLIVSLFASTACNQEVNVAMGARLDNILHYAKQNVSTKEHPISKYVIQFMDNVFEQCSNHVTRKEIAKQIKQSVELANMSIVLNFNEQFPIYKLFTKYKSRQRHRPLLH